jgi:hypothetical protein
MYSSTWQIQTKNNPNTNSLNYFVFVELITTKLFLTLVSSKPCYRIIKLEIWGITNADVDP